MQRAAADRKISPSRRLSLLHCQLLVQYAIDCLAIEGANRLSPHDRARLASAAAILKEICEGLERRTAAEPAPRATFSTRPAPSFPPDDEPPPLAAHRGKFVGKHQKTERNHPEAENRQEAEKTEKHQHDADGDPETA